MKIFGYVMYVLAVCASGVALAQVMSGRPALGNRSADL